MYFTSEAVIMDMTEAYVRVFTEMAKQQIRPNKDNVFVVAPPQSGAGVKAEPIIKMVSPAAQVVYQARREVKQMKKKRARPNSIKVSNKRRRREAF